MVSLVRADGCADSNRIAIVNPRKIGQAELCEFDRLVRAGSRTPPKRTIASAKNNSHGSREQSVAAENQSRTTEHQPPQQLQAAVHGEAGWQAGPTGTWTVTFCGTILQT
jgi:hypothetical protein